MAKGDGVTPCIVYTSAGPRVIGFYPDGPAAGLLLTGYREITVFPNRGAARAAIARTRRYVRANNLPWDIDYRIVRLVTPAMAMQPRRRKEGQS